MFHSVRLNRAETTFSLINIYLILCRNAVCVAMSFFFRHFNVFSKSLIFFLSYVYTLLFRRALGNWLAHWRHRNATIIFITTATLFQVSPMYNLFVLARNGLLLKPPRNLQMYVFSFVYSLPLAISYNASILCFAAYAEITLILTWFRIALRNGPSFR